MTRIDAAIFDLDGCLVDSEPLALEALASELRASGMADMSTRQIAERYLGLSIEAVCASLAQRSGPACPDGVAGRFEAALLERYRTDLRRMEHAGTCLDDLDRRGLALAIATGGSIRRMHETLRIAGLGERFDGRAFSADDVADGKPAPDLVLLAARGLGIAPDRCVVVEDSPHGVVGAVTAGMRAIGFVGGTHLDGMRDAQADRLKAAGAELVVATLEEIDGAIETLERSPPPSELPRPSVAT